MTDLSTLRATVEEFLAAHAVMTLATQGPEGPWAAPVYFAGALDGLYFLSSPRTRHGRNLAVDPRLAASVAVDGMDWQAIRGVQMEGACVLASGPREWLGGWRAYLGKFPAVRSLLRGQAGADVLKKVGGTRLYVIRPEHVFYLDNRMGFGNRVEVPRR